ncbi:hypothetical protein NLG97_g1113 [Lecanicillium saksenae]|uniref:Uncharacterized protein n=1 Tax=Lecanicillium saksenae TaxID=468837 RepID=A0ACC1R6F2_9HYPO|nr:hypothetical protein NLG97_g1113 [Lecanicillium saksenae]
MTDLNLESIRRELARLKKDLSSSGRLVVAIDFGTTYSGMAYCFPDQRDPKPEAILQWPGSNLRTFKVPTVLKYDSSDESKFEWGPLLKDPNNNIIRIKLLLDPNQKLPWHVPRNSIKETLNMLPPSKSPRGVATDFLRALKAHGMSQIATKVSQTALDLFDTEYVMSVPAVWSDAAKNETLEAAKTAGISPVTLIKEPEAAALYSIRQLDVQFSPGDVIVICDAGGGTVDLVSYEIEEILPTLRMKEVVPGTGAMVGSIALNRRFKAAVEEIIPGDRWNELKSSKAMTGASLQFENEVKRSFDGNLDEEYWVKFRGANLEDDPEKNLNSDEWTMTGADVKDIFDPVVDDILGLIRDQVMSAQLKKKTVKNIFLVGGFGSSPYLRKQVENAHEHIKVVQPDDAWAAIVKGAALSKVSSSAVVSSVSAVRHYGVTASYKFDSVIDKGQKSFLDYYTGESMANRLKWHINIGDEIKRGQKIRLGFFRTIPQHYQSTDLIFSDTLYHCSDGVAPTHKSESRTIKTNCVLKSNLSGVPRSKFRFNPGRSAQAMVPFHFGAATAPGPAYGSYEPYWEVHYDLKSQLAGRHLGAREVVPALAELEDENSGKRKDGYGTRRVEHGSDREIWGRSFESAIVEGYGKVEVLMAMGKETEGGASAPL